MQGAGFRVQGADCQFQGSGFRVQGIGYLRLPREKDLVVLIAHERDLARRFRVKERGPLVDDQRVVHLFQGSGFRVEG